MQSIQVQHGSRNVTVYYEVQRGRAIFWNASVPMGAGKVWPMNGALSGEHLGPDGVLDGLVASVRCGIEWLDSRLVAAKPAD